MFRNSILHNYGTENVFLGRNEPKRNNRDSKVSISKLRIAMNLHIYHAYVGKATLGNSLSDL